MAAKKKKIEQEVTEVQETVLPPAEPEPVVIVQPEPVAVEAPAPVRVRKNFITFAQWAKSKGVPSRHFAGMQAFLPNPDRSFTSEEWDEIFSKY